MAVHKSAIRVKKAIVFPFVDCMSMLLYSAFAIEAFLNHVGPKVFSHWAPLKKSLSPRDKIEVIAATKGVSIDWGSRPYQSLAAVLKFRNLVVHAETGSVDSSSMGYEQVVDGHWQSYCTQDFAVKVAEDIEKIISEFPIHIGIKMPRPLLLAEEDPEITNVA